MTRKTILNYVNDDIPATRDAIVASGRDDGHKNASDVKAAIADAESHGDIFPAIIRNRTRSKQYGYVKNKPIVDMASEVFRVIPDEGIKVRGLCAW